MKFFLRNIYLFIVFLSFSSNAQILDPVSWEFETVKITDTEYELVFTAEIDNKWSVYSQFIDGLGPVPTSFEFDENSKVEFVGDVIEDKNNRVTEQDPVFGIVVSKFYTEAKFTQKVIIKDLQSSISGYLTFMTCDDTRCLPPTDIDFRFDFDAIKSSKNDVLNTDLKSKLVQDPNILLYGYEPQEVISSSNNCNTEVSESNTEKNKTLFSIFGLGFIGGLLALLTPCVFPMIPMTVSFFTKQSKTKAEGIVNAIIYGISIIVIYVALVVGVNIIYFFIFIKIKRTTKTIQNFNVAISTNYYYRIFYFFNKNFKSI